MPMTKVDLMTAISRAVLADEDVAPVWDAWVASLDVKRDQNPIRVQIAPAVSGVALWRVYPQACWLAQDPRFDVRISTYLATAEADAADVMLFQRTFLPRMLVEMQHRAEAGKITILDLDDLIHATPYYNSARKRIIEEHQPELYDAAIPYCSLLTYSTDVLREVYGYHIREIYPRLTPRTAVLPLCVDEEAWWTVDGNPIRRYGRDAVVIGWEGSGTHSADLEVVAPVLADVMRDHQNVWVALGMCTQCGRGPLAGLPPERVFEFMWDGMHHLGGRYTGMLDIGLAPLALHQPCLTCRGQGGVQLDGKLVRCPICDGRALVMGGEIVAVGDNLFNRAKAPVKVLGYGLHGVPTVATDIEPYRHCGPTVLVPDNDPAKWREELERLIGDAELRRSLGESSREWVLQNSTVKQVGPQWTEAILGLMEGGRP